MTNDGPVGITFKETMSGGFALGVTETLEGETLGNTTGSHLELHADIEIDDIDRFIAEPAHQADLSGSIDFTPWGDDLQITHGVFNLFKPTDSPSLKLMVYEGGFQHAGKSYYLAGQKDVKDSSIFKLWSQTTTLYTQLFEGNNKSGEIVGAGVLHLGVKQLIALVSTLHATGASSKLQGAEAIGKFGKFFLGELWDSYVKHSPSSP